MKGNFEDITLPQEKFHGMYRGVVEDINDPLQAGRVRVRIFGMHSQNKIKSATDGIPTNELPWAEPAFPVMEGAASKFGFWSVPLVDSHVFIFFDMGNILRPIYFASAPGAADFDTGSGTYPHNTVLHFHGGHIIEIDSTPGNKRLKIFHPSGTVFTVDDGGNVDMEVVENETVNITGNQTITIGGSCNINITGTYTLTANGTITLNFTDVELGAGPYLTLLNSGAASVYNTHTHGSSEGPNQQMGPTTLTTNTKAS